jgi:hypothetical protein
MLTKLAKYKGPVIATSAAIVLLAAYVIPFDSLLGIATAAKGGNNNNGNPNSAQGGHPTNENAYKVCQKKIDKGQQVPPPKKCYGFESNNGA